MLEFPQDVMTAQVTAAVPQRVHRSRAPAPEEGDLRAAAELIEGARRPLLFAGGGAAAAADELRTLVEKLEAPVMVSRRGKGVLREDHPLVLCDVRGYLARQAMAEADCTIAVGCRFTSIDTAYLRRTGAASSRVRWYSYTPNRAKSAVSTRAMQAWLAILPRVCLVCVGG